MESSFSINHIRAVVAATSLLAPVANMAADLQTPASDKMATTAAPSDLISHSDRERTKDWVNEKEQLQRVLKLGQGKDFYTKTLADHGYQLTSINADKPDYLEYEVVKAPNSYEVHIDLDKAGAKATKVDVVTNIWRSDATTAAMRGAKMATATEFVPANEAYSDRSHMKAWSNEREKLEKSLAPGNTKGYYFEQLKDMGYQVTSTNDNKTDYVEYEIVKGGDSYEVQIDFDQGKARKVNVTTNMWQSDATEKALASKKQ